MTRSSQNFFKRNLTAVLASILVLVSILPFLGLFEGAYVFDDYYAIAQNKGLLEVRNFFDCFLFRPQSMRPVSNFFLALGQLLSPDAVLGQRLISILVHSFVVLLIFANLRLWCGRLKEPPSKFLPFWVALLYAINPIHIESLAIAQFRSEVLATFFLLISMWATQLIALKKPARSGWPHSVLFLAMGLSALSKESFALLTPLVIFLFYAWELRSKDRERISGLFKTGFLWMVCGFAAFWGGVLAFFRTLPPSYLSSWTSYGGKVGLRVVDLDASGQTKIAARALLEGLIKIFSGVGLSTVRLAIRSGPGDKLSLPLCALILLAFSGAMVIWWRKDRRFGLWAAALLVGIGIYLFIPNINIRSEHYWYFPALPLLVLFISSLEIALGKIKNGERMMWVATLSFCLYLAIPLESRILDFRSLFNFYLSETETHPEVQRTWADLADYLVVSSGKVESAWPYVLEAKKHFPDDPYFLVTEFLYYREKENFDATKEAVAKIVARKLPSEKMLQIYYDFGVVGAKQGKCDEAARAFSKALVLDPKNGAVQEAMNKIVALKKSHPENCH